jgi:hypothetical protein
MEETNDIRFLAHYSISILLRAEREEWIVENSDDREEMHHLTRLPLH